MTEHIVICTKHGHYLKFVGMTGLVWTTARSEAKTWPTEATAEKAANRARLMLHTPVAQKA